MSATNSNAAFLRTHAAPGRIGLVGGNDITSTWIGKVQAFLFDELRIDGHWWIVESDLDIRYRHLRIGVQQNRLDRCFDDAKFAKLAVLDFGMNGAALHQVPVAALDLAAGLADYVTSELAGTLATMQNSRLRRRRNDLQGRPSCSAWRRSATSGVFAA